MPELPEVETTVRGLRPVLDGARLASVETRRGDLRRPFPVDLRQRMTGATITGLGRRAKYGLIATDRGDTMIFHLGMSGRWRVDPAEVLPHDHLLIATEAGRHLALNDPRRFGSVDLWPTETLDAYPPFGAMGPEPLGPDLTAEYLLTALAGRKASIKLMLLDQRIVAGLGNIYVLCSCRESRRRRRRGGYRCRDWSDSSSRSGTCCWRRSRRADHRCATMRALTANWDIFPSNSRSMVARASHVPAAAR
jgi:DNA-formamidopyrimidine glycosylase